MSIQGNQFMQEREEIMEENQKESKLIFEQFENKFETIKAFVEDLRQLQIQITAKEDSDISKYTQAIINYLQHPDALNNEKLYRNSLISLGNFLSIKYSFLKKEFLSQKFFKNLIQYFSLLCEKQTQQDFNMLVYPVLYLVVLIIYNADKQTAKLLHSKLFVKKFLKALCSVEFKEGNKIQRYLPVIIAFVAKGSHATENTILLKNLVLNNLHFSEIEKNQFHFIYSLRILINKESFTLAEVRKYGILEYLVKYLQKNATSEQTVSMVLEVMKHILKRHQILSYKLVSSDFLSIIESAYKVNPDNVLSLLEVICPCLPYSYKYKMLSVHTELLRKYQNQNINSIDLKQLQSLKIISIIIEEISFNDLLIFIQKYSIQGLLQRTFRGEKKLTSSEEQEVVSLLTKIIKSLSVENQNIKNSLLLIISEYRRQNRRILTLVETYKSDFQNSFILM